MNIDSLFSVGLNLIYLQLHFHHSQNSSWLLWVSKDNKLVSNYVVISFDKIQIEGDVFTEEINICVWVKTIKN